MCNWLDSVIFHFEVRRANGELAMITFDELRNGDYIDFRDVVYPVNHRELMGK